MNIYYWDFGDGTLDTTTGPNVSHLYASYNTFDVLIKVENNSGCEGEQTLQVIVRPNPIASLDNILTCDSVFCFDTPIFFNNISFPVGNLGGIIDSCIWDVNGLNIDTVIGSNISFSHIFSSNSNNYNSSGFDTTNFVTMIAVDEFGCSSNDTFRFDIAGNPEVYFDVFSDTLCSGEILNIDSISSLGYITNYYWSIDSVGFVMNDTNLISTNTPFSNVVLPQGDSTANYNVNVLATSCCPTPGSYNYSDIIVSPIPDIDFTVQPLTVGCSPCDQYLWTDIQGLTDTLFVDWGDGSSSVITAIGQQFAGQWQDSISHQYQNPSYAPDTFDIQIIGKNDCGVDTFNTSAICYAAGVQGYLFSNSNSFNNNIIEACVGEPVTFQGADITSPMNFQEVRWSWNYSNSSPNWSSYEPWDPLSGTNYILQTNTWNTSGLYTVVFEYRNNCSTNADTVYVRILPSPEADFSIPNPDFCMGDTLLLIDDSDLDTSIFQSTVSSYIWTITDQSGSVLDIVLNDTLEYYNFNNSGLYQIDLQLISNYQCSDVADTDFIIYHDNPIADMLLPASACEDQYVQIQDNSQPFNPTLQNWINIWDTQDSLNNFGNISNPNAYYNNPGFYQVTLTIEDVNGCKGEDIDTIEIFQKPRVNFVTDSVCFNDLTSFIDSSFVVHLPASYNWSFGDTITNPQYQFSSCGLGQNLVELVIVDANQCSDSITKPVYIYCLPDFSLDIDSVCFGTGELVNLEVIQNSGVNYYDWDWTIEGQSYNGNSVSHLFDDSCGVYDVLVQVSDSVSDSRVCSRVDSGIAIVYCNPEVDILFSEINNIFCENQSVISFNDVFNSDSIFGGFPSDYLWDIDPGNYVIGDSTWSDVGFTFTNSGNFNIQLTITDNWGCSVSADSIITINATPYIDIAPVSARCQEEEFSFVSIFNDPNLLYNWNFDDPFSSSNIDSIANPLHTYNAAGIYYPVLQVTNIFGCINTILDTVQVDTIPRADFNWITVCEGTPTPFDDASIETSNTIVDWEWDFGNSNIVYVSSPNNPDTSNQFISINNNFTFPVTLRVVDDNLCSHDTTKNITIWAQPDVSFIPPGTECSGELVDFIDQSFMPDNTQIDNWTWYWGDFSGPTNINASNSNNGNASHQFPENPCVNNIGSPAIHYVTLQVQSEYLCEATSPPIPVMINPTPVADFEIIAPDGYCGDIEVVFSDQSCVDEGSIWQYDFGNAPIVTYTNSLDVNSVPHTYSGSGIYYVEYTVTNSDNCSDTHYDTVVTYNNPSVDISLSNSAGCEILYVDIIDDSFAAVGDEIIAWNWDFTTLDGPNNPPLEPNNDISDPVDLPFYAGQYQIDLSVVTEQGCVSNYTYPANVVVDATPAPAYPIYHYNTITNDYDIYNGEVYFSAIGSMSSLSLNADSLKPSNIGYLYQWDIDGEFVHEGYDFVHQFESNSDYQGTNYNVCLTIISPLGCDTTICDTINNMYFNSLYIPNALTPGYNVYEAQIFLPKGKSLMEFGIQVYDKWGNLLWESYDELDNTGSPTGYWDGTYNGKNKLVPSGVYYYVVTKAVFSNGQAWDGKRKGTITLIR